MMMVLCMTVVFAQAPEKFSYQAVVRNASNQLIANAPVSVRMSILQGSADDVVVYVETHAVTTNANGLLTVEIGGGTVQQGVFADIDWTNGPLFLKTETDPDGGTNYTVTSVQQLLSVPYALYAKEAGNVPQNVGELTNDANYITMSDIPEIPTVPTNVSAFNNDAGYLTDYTETQTLAQVTANGNSAGNRQLKNVSDPTENLDAVNLRTLVSQMNSLQDSIQQQMQRMQHQIDSLKDVINTLNADTTDTDTAVIDEKSCPAAPTVTDHEGNVYATVQIGNQCWMRDNLRTTTSPSTGTYLIPAANANYTYTGKQARWYNNDSATYAPMNYGLLYNWNAAVDTFNTTYGETSVNTSDVNAVSVTFNGHRRGICPEGWHLPSDAEWTQLTNYVSSQNEYQCGSNSSYIAKALASTEGWITYTNNCAVGNDSGANNATGFSAVPAGDCSGSSFNLAGLNANFCSSTQNLSYHAYNRNLYYDYAAVLRYANDKSNGFSVRCLRD